MELHTTTTSLQHHKRSKSDYNSIYQVKRRHFTNTMVQNSLKQEILELEKQLENQFAERGALESAMFCKPASDDFAYEYSISKTAKDLIKEVTVLELEIVYLERYLLSLYRKTFSKSLASRNMMDERARENSATDEPFYSETSQFNTTKNSAISAGYSIPSEDSLGNSLKESRDILGAQVLIDSSIGRSHSSLSQRSPIALRNSSLGTLAEAVESYHSLPLSMLERVQNNESVSLTEHPGTRVQDRFWEMPNKISEEMVKSMCAIYYQLADPPLHDFPSSPMSLSTSRSSPRDQYDTWNLQSKENSWLDNSFRIESSKELIPPFPTVAEVQGIRRDSQSLTKIEPMLEKFRCLVLALKVIEPKKMKHEEKLAFWINVHNSLVMHAVLVYGIRRSNLKRISLQLKAAYNVGGHTISVDMIHSSILGCRLPRPGQWLQSFFFPRSKYKAGDSWKAYGIVHPEPRLHFALCTGSHSDPVVRLYTPERVFQELEVAKEEYIQANVKVQKELKLMMPKKVDSFAKESGLSQAGLLELIEHSLPGSLRKFKQSQQEKFSKKIVWIPHNFTFRYLISDELLN